MAPATRVAPAMRTRASTKAGLDQPRPTVALLAKLASRAGARREAERERPRIRAYEGTCRSRQDARPAMKAELSPGPIWLPLLPRSITDSRSHGLAPARVPLSSPDAHP